jgi:hypothetical protein
VVMGGVFNKLKNDYHIHPPRLFGGEATGSPVGMDFVALSQTDNTLYSIKTPLGVPTLIGPVDAGTDPVELIEASPDRLYTVDRATQTLITIDRFSGAVLRKVLLDHAIPTRPRGFELSPDGILYGIFPGIELRAIDPLTGTTTLITKVSGAAQIESIAFASDGTLYVSGSIANDGNSESLFRLSLTTGQLSLIGNMGVADVDEITFGSDGFIYGVNSQGGVKAHLLKIDPATARTLDVGSTGVSEVTGIVAIRQPGVPVLKIDQAGSSMVLSWPTNAESFSLESATDLGPPSFWKRVATEPAMLARTFVVTNSPDGGRSFYRLRK